MFGSSNPFGQAFGSSPYGTQTQSGFGQSNNTSNNNPFAQKPFDTSTPFGVQTGSSMFGGTSTGVFGAPQTSSPFGASSQAFGNSTPAFGASSTSAFGNSASTFGGSSTFGQMSFGLSTPQASPFGNYTFGNSNTPAFGASSTSAFGATNTPAFGATSTPGFGATSTTGFGASSTSAFGSTNTPAFGASSSPAFGASPTPAFGSSGTAFGSGGGFGASSTPALGASSSPSFNFGSSPAFGQSTSAFGSTSFGSTQSSFGVQDSKSMFGCQSTIRGQEGGSRVMPYPHTNLRRKKRKMILNLNLKKSNPGPQNVNKGKSHTSMPPPSPQIPLQNFSEGDVPRKDQNNSNIPDRNKRPRRDESSSSKSALADVSFVDDTHKRRMVIAESFREFTSNGEKPLPSFDEWDPHARDLYVRNSIQQAKVAAGFNDTVRFYESALKRRVPLEDFAAVEKRISDLQMKIKSDASLIGLVDQLKKERDNALDSLKLSQEKINVLVHELNAMRASSHQGRSISREFDELKQKYDALLKSSEADRERSTDENRCDVRSHCRGLIKEIANHFDSLKARKSDVHELSTNQSLLAHFEKKDFNLVKEEKEVKNSLAEAEAQLRSIPYSNPDLEKNNSVFDELLSFEDPLGVPPKATQGQTSSRIVEESPPFSEEGLPNDKNSARASSSHP